MIENDAHENYDVRKTPQKELEMIPIEVRSKSDGMELKILEFAEHRISFALDRLQRVRRISISVQDLNGPKGGVDKYCRITAQFGFGFIVIEETQPTWQSAVTNAIRRLARKASQGLQRTNRPSAHNRNPARRQALRNSRSPSEQGTIPS